MSTFKDWFGIGRLGPYIATPSNLFGWLTTLGLTLPALIYAVLGGGLGRLLAGGLFAFLFGFSYAIANERRGDKPRNPPASAPDASTLSTVNGAPRAG